MSEYIQTICQEKVKHFYNPRVEDSDLLRAGKFGYRMSVRAKFSAIIQNGPGDNPFSCAMGNVSFPGVNAAEA